MELFSQRSYFLHCFGEMPSGLESAPFVVRSFPGSLLEINFRNSVGLTRIGPFNVTVRNNKLSQEQFESMLSEVLDGYANLAFNFAASTGANVARKALGSDVSYLQFLFLRRELLRATPDLNALLGLILKDPHHIPIRNVREAEASEVRNVSQRTVLDMIGGRHPFMPLHGGHPLRDTPLVARLKNVSGRPLFPVRVTEEYVQNTHDTDENRFVKWLLQNLLRLGLAMRRCLGDHCGNISWLNPDILKDLDALQSTLEEGLSHALWRQVGGMTRIPANSQVLQRRDGYRQLFRVHALLQLATSLETAFPDFENIVDLKDAATLYEYWCFFKVKDVLDAKGGVRAVNIHVREDALRRDLQTGICLEYAPGLRLWYNRYCPGAGPREWREDHWSGATSMRESYSHNLIPDIVLEKDDRLFILDAKCKGERTGFYCEQDSEHELRWKDEDINKMHAYKDAISGVHSAMIMYPGHESAFFFDNNNAFGVGAMAIRPGDNRNPCNDALLKDVIMKFCE